MEYASLPIEKFKMSRIGLGTWAIGGWLWGGTDEKNSIYTIQKAIDMGINLIDTAPAYGFGLAEELIGKALTNANLRDKAIIATKAGISWDKDENVSRDASKVRIRKEFEDSLIRLKTDYIDIYQLHWPDPKVSIHEAAGVLGDLYKEGKIRAIGVSNFSIEQMDEWREIAPLHSSQPPFNLFEKEASQDILSYCNENGIGVLAYGSLCRGLLTGKFSRSSQFPEGDLRNNDPKFNKDNLPNYLNAVEKLMLLAKEKGKTVAQLAVRWVIDQPGITSALWGARRPNQLDEVVDVSGWSLDKADMDRIYKIINETIPKSIGPEFMAPPS